MGYHDTHDDVVQVAGVLRVRRHGDDLQPCELEVSRPQKLDGEDAGAGGETSQKQYGRLRQRSGARRDGPLLIHDGVAAVGLEMDFDTHGSSLYLMTSQGAEKLSRVALRAPRRVGRFGT